MGIGCESCHKCREEMNNLIFIECHNCLRTAGKLLVDDLKAPFWGATFAWLPRPKRAHSPRTRTSPQNLSARGSRGTLPSQAQPARSRGHPQVAARSHATQHRQRFSSQSPAAALGCHTFFLSQGFSWQRATGKQGNVYLQATRPLPSWICTGQGGDGQLQPKHQQAPRPERPPGSAPVLRAPITRSLPGLSFFFCRNIWRMTVLPTNVHICLPTWTQMQDPPLVIWTLIFN